MSLTTAGGPLSRDAAATNYTIDGPAHRIAFMPFGRRLRLQLGDVTVLDTADAMLLHETGIRPRLYVPLADVTAAAELQATDTTSFCPFKGDASYRTVRAGGRESADALWTYEAPVESAPWLAGYAGVYEERFDQILDEDEEVLGHLTDPYHRIDIRTISRAVTVTAADGTILARSTRAVLLAETAFPNRYYLPRADVRCDLEPSTTYSVCGYKGTASYWSANGVQDVAWSYEEPLSEALRIAGLVSFWEDSGATTTVAPA
ncbi:hypothetical protein DSM112329_03319 [Paraconexibacter sp. AEG42_29]|uniref:DUF427 domain-containing protein n=1 Tax=Paraconexibacter sp. AEG42_29 TaxID=2997339 RepID=A0AAU7AXS2_9ACTN